MTVTSCTASGREGVRTDHEIRLARNLEHVRHKILVMSGKGGVGKSTVATNLALALSMRSFDVGLLDCDIHGPTIPRMLGIESARPSVSNAEMEPISVSPHLKVMSMGFLLPDSDTPVVWRGPVKMRVIGQFLEEMRWGKLDYLIIDLPPGTGDEPLSVAQLVPRIDGAVIVTTPQDVALLSVRKSIGFAKALHVPVIGVIENMSGFTCPHCSKEADLFGSGGGLKMALDMNVPFLGRIPFDPDIVKCGDSGAPCLSESGDCRLKGHWENLVRKVEKFVNGNQGDLDGGREEEG